MRPKLNRFTYLTDRGWQLRKAGWMKKGWCFSLTAAYNVQLHLDSHNATLPHRDHVTGQQLREITAAARD